jgi:hypothetical protein
MENTNEIWQTSVNGQIYETDFAGLVDWISEGSLLPQDKVRRGNLRWIEADKVPALHRFFNAMQLEENTQVVTSTVQNSAPIPQVQNFSVNAAQPATQNFQTPPPPTFYKEITPEAERKFCAIHTDANAKYHCEMCGSYFCKACPNNRVCPMCGADCKTIEVPFVPPPVVHQPFLQPNQNQEVVVGDDVRKAANWCYWKAGITVLNSIIGLSGSVWAFFLGMTLPQVFQGFAAGASDELQMKGTNGFHIVAFILSLACAGFMFFLGKKAAKGKKWAVIWGLVIFACDALLYLLTIGYESSIKSAIFGVGVHVIAIVYFSKALQSLKK